MPVVTEWDLQISIDQVLRAQGASPGYDSRSHPLILSQAERALIEGSPLLQPALIYQEYRVQKIQHQRISFSGGGSLSGKGIVLHLAAARSVIIAACTVGSLLDDFVRAVFKADPIYALALDAMGSAAIQTLSEKACSYLAERASPRGWETTLPINPGSEDWPVEQAHQEVFALLDPTPVGISRTASGMMHPLKSLTMVLGQGPDVDNSGRVCDYCTMRNSCRYQDHYDQYSG
jgi:hypothetical protein